MIRIIYYYWRLSNTSITFYTTMLLIIFILIFKLTLCGPLCFDGYKFIFDIFVIWVIIVLGIIFILAQTIITINFNFFCLFHFSLHFPSPPHTQTKCIIIINFLDRCTKILVLSLRTYITFKLHGVNQFFNKFRLIRFSIHTIRHQIKA